MDTKELLHELTAVETSFSILENMDKGRCMAFSTDLTKLITKHKLNNADIFTVMISAILTAWDTRGSKNYLLCASVVNYLIFMATEETKNARPRPI